ncbi:hypothetical protein STEG23_026818 [Scotinomys teguina]
MVNSFLRPIQRMLKQRDLKAYQDSMSESDSKEKGNLKEERPESSKASSKLHTKVEKEKETDQGKKEKETDQGKTKQKPSGLYLVLDEFKQKPSGLYPVLDEFADITLSDSAEDELDSEEEEDLEEAVAAYERERGIVVASLLPFLPSIMNSQMHDINVMLDKAYAHTVQALEKKGLYIAPEKVQKDSIEARTALAKVETAITNAQLNRIDDTLPLSLCVLPTKIFPTAVLWQKGPLLWIHPHASPGRTIENYPTSVASLALQGIKLALIHFATEPQLLIQLYTPKQVQILAATVYEWAVLVCSFSGVLDNHYTKDNLLLFIIHHPVIFPKVTAMEPLKGAIEIYTDGSKSGVGAYVLQGQEPVQFRFLPNTPQIVECQIVYEVFKRFHEPFNLLSDSHYVVNAVRGLETSAFIKESSPVHDILWDICVLIRDRTAPFFIGHIRAHTLLPGPMTAANDLADKATRAFAAVELDSKSMAKQFHQLYHVPAHTLCLKFRISQQLARDIVKACPSCMQFLHPPHMGINPKGLHPGDLWQMDVTHISSFGKLSYVHVSVDTCSGVIFASPLSGEKDQENPIWIPERLTHFIRHEDPDSDTSDKPDSSPDQSRTGDAVVGSDQNVTDPDAKCWNGTWTLAVIAKVPTFVPIPVEVDPKTFPILTLLRERRDFGITAAIEAAIALSTASAVTAAVAMTNQIQTAQTINTVVEQTSAVMETQHQINKHLISGIVAANQRMDFIQTQVEELFGLVQIRCIAKLKHMCVTLLRFDEAGNENREIASYLAGNWTQDDELLVSQQLLQIAALNETRVEPISLGDFTDWLSSAFSFFKEWVGVGIFGAICCFGIVLNLWFLCRLRARQARDKAVIIQALAVLDHGVSTQVWLASLKEDL